MAKPFDYDADAAAAMLVALFAAPASKRLDTLAAVARIYTDGRMREVAEEHLVVRDNAITRVRIP